MKLFSFTTAVVALLPFASALPAPADSGPKTVTADGRYFQTVLDHHNVHRKNHTVPPLTWSQSMHQSAKILAQSCSWGHNTSILGGGYGQNIAAGSLPSQISGVITGEFYNGEVIDYSWYGEEPNLSTFENYGHFTQVVWKSTQQVGCYTADCSATGIQGLGPSIMPYFTVCNYFPSGNWVSEFGANVLQPINMPTVGSNWTPSGTKKSKSPASTHSATLFMAPQNEKVGTVVPS